MHPPRAQPMTAGSPRQRVLIAGGGIAALELLLALRVLAGGRVAITLLTRSAQLAPRAMSVGEPFARAARRTHDWTQIAAQQDARLVLDTLVAVDTHERIAHTHGGRRIPYDVLVLATGARRVGLFAGALTFGAGDDGAAARLRQLVAELPDRPSSILAFTLPSPSAWSLPLYELALLAAHELREHGSPVRVRIVTPEHHALELLGPAARDALEPLLAALGIELMANAQPRAVVERGIELHGGDVVAADHVVALADVVARPVAGVPTDRAGFVPVDVHGAVAGEPALFAAGEATSFPMRQGGLAAQQADAVAQAIAAGSGADVRARPFRPVLRGRLMTSGAPLYLQSRPSGQSLASHRALWSPPEKVAGRYLAAYLGTAQPGRIGAAALAERVPQLAGEHDGDEHDAVTLADALAEAELRCSNYERARAALDAAAALEPGREDAVHARLRERLAAEVVAR